MPMTVNGRQHDLTADMTLESLLDSLGLDASRVAVERNLEIVPRERFADTLLKDGDTLEIVQFVGGG